jgi:hypothetical protein
MLRLTKGGGRLTACAVAACLLLGTHWVGPARGAEPTRAEILDAMQSAAGFMAGQVALNGGYVWTVSEDLTQRWGEIRARPSQIWLQGGTERVGQVMLDAWQATGDDFYLDIAREAADAIVFGQLPAGGWHYFIDFDPSGVAEWYATTSSRFRFGMEEYRHFYGNATFDDRVTQDAAAFLLRFYVSTREAAYRGPVLKALEFVIEAQYPNGAWPQRFPPRDEYSHDGFPDYTSYYTLNDGVADANIELLLDAYRTLGDLRYLNAARRGVDALVAMQGSEGQGCWAEQYGFDMRPVAARTHEPPGYVVRESIWAMNRLAQFYLVSGDRKYLQTIPRCLEWFDRINRESAADRYPIPRYWEPGTNRPLYVVPTDETTPEGYGVYRWTTDPAQARCSGKPCEGDGKPVVDVAVLRAQYDDVANLSSPASRATFLDRMLQQRSAPPSLDESIADIIAALDSRGAWVTDGIRVNEPNARTEAELHPLVRGISTRTFVDRMSMLIAAVNDAEGEN